MKLSVLSVCVAVFIGGCANKAHLPYNGKIDKTSYQTEECRRELSRGLEIIKSKKIDKIVVLKKQRVLMTYRKGKMVNKFRISLGKNGDKGHKIRAGDYRTPIGHYYIVRKKCDSRLYKSLMISYPDREDIARARKLGVKSGGYITIHAQPKWNANGIGDDYTLSHDWTEGCIAVSNKAMDKLWRAVQCGVKIDIHP